MFVEVPARPVFNVEIFVQVDGIRRSDRFELQVAGPDDIVEDLRLKIDRQMDAAMTRAFAMPEQDCVGICSLSHTVTGARFFMFFRVTPLNRADLMHQYMRELTDQMGAFLCGDSAFNQRFSGTSH
ncbi:hypothetical protein OIV19_21720 [Brucella sp. HL-2]|nr:hypothetical protein [Brucella sp. HL-2]MCV9910216.1 hypothetical protein [Brucella sp. HL-2]